ncbi:MAG TPA: sugar kinase [Porphyromonadaceae bacterium]|nr:sugar kinase [Porphyromonadaceae bacterium]
MIVGIDLGGTNIRIGRVKEGMIVDKISKPSPSELSLEESLEYLKDAIRDMLTDEVTGIGIGVPSVLDISRGIVYHVANIPSWKEVHLKDILQKEFRLPVYINNDSNCFALGEKEYGLGRDYKDLIGVTLGTGVGVGVIINHNLYGGRNTGAGEVGCIPYLDATLEDYCGSNFFVSHYHTTGKDLADKANEGDVSALKIWGEFGTHMGKLIQTILYVYDPQLIILGGGIADAYRFFEKKMKEIMQQFPYPETVKNIEIKVSENTDISMLGAAALVSKQLSTY